MSASPDGRHPTARELVDGDLLGPAADVPAVGEAVEPPEVDGDYRGMPRAGVTRREAIIFGGFTIAVVAFLYFGLPRLAGIDDTWSRIREGDPRWLLACLLFELVSFAGYVWLFRAVYLPGSQRIDWRVSYQITMAGLAATRLFAAAGAGGAALTAWALRRSGMRPRTVAVRMVAQYVLLYGVYMLTLVLVGIGLHEGILSGGDEFAITVVPAIFGAVVIVVALAFTLVPTQIDRTLERWAGDGGGRWAGLLVSLAKAPAAVSGGVREALRIAHRREGGMAGAVVWWYFDIATLWAAFHAFGHAPAFFVIVMAYFVGMLGNLLPLPGGIGGVDGGMIGAFVAFGVPFSLATVAVLTYRAFAFWLPTIPGAIAYLQLRGTVARWREEGVEGAAPARVAAQTGSLPAL